MTTHLDIKQIHDAQPLYYDRESVGTGSHTYDTADGGVTLAVGTSGDAAIVQSKMFAPYYAGKGQFIEITFSDMTHDTDVVKRAGYFSSNTTTPWDSDKDGVWFESDGTDYRIKIEKNGTSLLNVAQSAWNLDDISDNDLSKFNVLVIQFLYLGGTSVKIGFIVDGNIKWAHQYDHAGVIAGTFLESPQQPVRYEIRSTGGSGDFIQICAQVASEGSVDEIGREVGLHLGADTIDANSTSNTYALIGVRLKSAYRDVRVDVDSISLLARTNDDVRWSLILNPTVAGTFTFGDITNTAIQAAYGDTVSGGDSDTTVTGGTVVATGYFTGNTDVTLPVKSNIRIGSKLDGTMDELVLCAQPLSSNLDITGAINIQEFL